MKKETTPDATDVLMRLGLSALEAKVYQVALSLGSRPASVIAKKAQLKRGQGYNVLRNLMDKGIVQEFEKSGVKYFTCAPPSSLVSIVREREEQLKRAKADLLQLIPALEKIRQPLSGAPKLRLYSGFEGLKQIYEGILEEADGTDLYTFADFEFVWSTLQPKGPEYVADFVKRRTEKKMCWHGIVADKHIAHTLLDVRPSRYRKVKFVNDLLIPCEVSIFGTKVAYLSANDGMVIDDAVAAETGRNIFQFIWDGLPGPIVER